MSLNPYERVAARIRRPAKPQERTVEALVRKYDTSAAAWRRLAERGLLPQGWALPGPRRFRAVAIVKCIRCGGKGRVGGYSGDPDEWEEGAWTCSACDSQGVVIERETDMLTPPSKGACISLARDPQGAATAEVHAAECATRLALWGFSTGRQTVWRVGGPLPICRWSFSEELRIFDFIQKDEPEVWKSPAFLAFYKQSYDVGVGAFYAHAQRHAQGDQFWRNASARGDVVRVEYNGVQPPRGLVGRRFADLPCPFSPLLAIWELGYVPVSITPALSVLLAPD